MKVFGLEGARSDLAPVANGEGVTGLGGFLVESPVVSENGVRVVLDAKG
jgi:hypothetical protein